MMHYRFICFLINFVLLGNFTFAKQIEVCQSCTVNNIQEAINQANPHDEIIVLNGEYFVNNLLINKPLTFTGSTSTILNGNNQGEILNIKADSVLVKNFTFKNVGVSYTKDWAAISTDEVKNISITNNKFEKAFFGIYLRKSSIGIIENNHFEGFAKEEISSGNAIHLWYCNQMVIKNNIVLSHRDGIYLEFVKNSEVIGNISKNNIRYGLHFMFSDNNNYLNNIFSHNGSGVAVMYSQKINMINNEFSNNWGPSAYGLLLKEIKDGSIKNNRFIKNSSAVFGEGVQRMQIENNRFELNGWAIKIFSTCMDNTFKYNNFVENSFSVFTNTPRNYNLFEQNYWSEYAGYDLDKNGIGDVPHKPVSLFTFLVEQCEPALMLLKSNFIWVLELAEKAVPTITPDNIVDLQPKMRPYDY